MLKHFKHTRRTAVTAALGVIVAFGGANYAAAQSGVDAASRTSETAASTVIGKSFVRWTKAPIVLPVTAPAYSQINFMSDDRPANSGWTFSTSQIGQAHASGTVLLKKASGGGPAEVTCDLRVDGLPASSEFMTTISDSGESRLSMPLTGAFNNVPAGAHNVGIRCWNRSGPQVAIEKADLHAVVYSAAA